AKLAESRSDKYNVTTEKDPNGGQKLALTNPEGDKVDTEDAEVKMHLMEAKINMAKEHRAALREVLLMGVTRLVVEKGEIEAAVEFTIKAKRDSKAGHKDTNINTKTGSVGGALDFGIFQIGGGYDESNTNIQVNTSNKAATDDLTA